MKKEEISMMKFMVRVVVVIVAQALFTSTVPALLSAANDIAVLIGVGIIVACIAGAFRFWKNIINWFKDIN